MNPSCYRLLKLFLVLPFGTAPAWAGITGSISEEEIGIEVFGILRKNLSRRMVMTRGQICSAILFRLLAPALGLFLVCSAALAQTTNGAFHGNITDTSGATVPDATVRITDLESGAVRQMATDSSGYYAIPNLRPGQYSISVAKSGFETAQMAKVQLLVNHDLLNLA